MKMILMIAPQQQACRSPPAGETPVFESAMFTVTVQSLKLFSQERADGISRRGSLADMSTNNLLFKTEIYAARTDNIKSTTCKI